MTDLVQQSLFHPPPRDASLRVGPAGWNYKDWEGVVYPADAGRSFDPLAFLVDYFDTHDMTSPALPQFYKATMTVPSTFTAAKYRMQIKSA
jgi:hypothetical protein